MHDTPRDGKNMLTARFPLKGDTIIPHADTVALNTEGADAHPRLHHIPILEPI